jgi:hypothetical protein
VCLGNEAQRQVTLLAPVLALDSRVHVDAGRAHCMDGRADVVGIQAAREDNRFGRRPGEPLAYRPVVPVERIRDERVHAPREAIHFINQQVGIVAADDEALDDRQARRRPA